MLAARLKGLRTGRKMTQNDIARMLGVTQQAVARWENGKSEPDTTTLNWFSRFFEVSLDYLLGNEENQPSPITKEEKTLLTDFASLTVEGKHTLLNVLNSLKMTHAVSR